MKVVISNRIGAPKTTGTGKWPNTSTHEPLLRTLREAAKRAARHQRSILASFTYLIEWDDAIRVFTGARLAGLGECFFWERPVEQNTLVGVGAAATIETNGITCFTNAASDWRTLLNDAVVTYAHPTASAASSGPLLFGGFTFDPLSPRTHLWSDFPDGLLILPQILLSYNANHVALTVNRMMRASDDIEQCANEIEASVRQLQEAMERIPAIQREDTFSEFSLHELRPASEWMEMVASMVDMIQHGAFEKVVLARDIQLKLHDSPGAFDISSTLQRLRGSYPTAYVFAIQRGECFFVGATPDTYSN